MIHMLCEILFALNVPNIVYIHLVEKMSDESKGEDRMEIFFNLIFCLSLTYRCREPLPVVFEL